MKRFLLQYKILDERGDTVQASPLDQWQEYQAGQSELEGFDAQLQNMQAGDERAFAIEAAAAYGDYDESRIMTLARDQFPDEIPIQEKQIVSFAAPTGQEVVGMIIDFNDDFVQVDFNHPLAGKTLNAWVKIKQIEDME